MTPLHRRALFRSCLQVACIASVAVGRTTSGAVPTPPPPTTLRVGPARLIKTIAAASRLARDGDTIEVDAGEYEGDVAVWTQDGLVLKAVDGRARLVANGQAAENKSIWVVRAERVMVQGFDFSGARVPDGNGAGIRLESGSLEVRDCRFTGNENGILTGNNPRIRLDIDSSEFGFNGAGDGFSHNLYAGAIASLSVIGSYFHHARTGHLLKSRAAVNRLRYNRLTDESDGQASYELDLPNGGLAFVIGNIIQQSPSTENSTLIAYGEEGFRWPRNELYLVNNTLVDRLPSSGAFLRVAQGQVRVVAANNLLVGAGRFDVPALSVVRNNALVSVAEFVDPSGGDYRLKRRSRLSGRAIDIGRIDGEPLMPEGEFRSPHRWEPLREAARHPGASQTLE